MSSSDQTELIARLERERRTRLVRVSLFIGAPIVLVLGWMTFQWYQHVVAPGKNLEAIVARAREVGIPWTAKELAGDPSLPIFPNQEESRFKVNERESDFRKALEKIRERDGRAALALLKSYDRELQPYAEALDRDVRFADRDYDLSWMLLLPEYSSNRALGRLFGARAIARAQIGDATGATAELRRIRQLAKMCSRDSLIIGQLVALSAEDFLLRTVPVLADEWQDDSAKLRALELILDDDPTKGSVARAMRGEAYAWVAMFRNLEKWGGYSGVKRLVAGSPSDNNQTPTGLRKDGYPKSFEARTLMAETLKFYIPIFEASRAGKGDLELIDLFADRHRKLAQGGIAAAILREASPSVQGWRDTIVRHQAIRDCTRLLIQSLEFRADKGRWPNSQAELKTDVKDPFSEQPYLFSVSEGALRIYSVGPNRKDDGGLTGFEARKPGENLYQSGDIVVASPPIDRAPFGRG